MSANQTENETSPIPEGKGAVALHDVSLSRTVVARQLALAVCETQAMLAFHDGVLCRDDLRVIDPAGTAVTFPVEFTGDGDAADADKYSHLDGPARVEVTVRMIPATRILPW
jgi:hypothetical protein